MRQIAAELSVTPPALYRYVSSRNEVLTELTLVAYRALEDVTAQAARASLSVSPGARLLAYAQAWRAQALTHPHEYRLLFTEPLPGCQSYAPQLARAASTCLLQLLELSELLDDPAQADPRRQDSTELPTGLVQQLDGWLSAHDDHQDTPASRTLQAVTIWWRVHGLLTLELNEAFAAVGLDPAPLFARETAALTRIG